MTKSRLNHNRSNNQLLQLLKRPSQNNFKNNLNPLQQKPNLNQRLKSQYHHQLRMLPSLLKNKISQQKRNKNPLRHQKLIKSNKCLRQKLKLERRKRPIFRSS